MAKFGKGELVRVVEPLVFVRCGYPLDPGEVQEKIAREHMARVREFLNFEGGKLEDYGPYDDWMDSRARLYAVRALASQYLHKHRFGGNQRRIHTAELPELKGRVCKVIGWQFKKTGDYYPPSTYGGGWDGPSEWEPGGLSNMKTHRVLHLEATDTYKTFKIEDCHVAKLDGEA